MVLKEVKYGVNYLVTRLDYHCKDVVILSDLNMENIGLIGGQSKPREMWFIANDVYLTLNTFDRIEL